MITRTVYRKDKVLYIEEADDDTRPTEEELEQQSLDAGYNLSSINRMIRDNLLAQSDWTQVPDSPLSTEQKTLWATYRTQLRDITSHDNWPQLLDEDWPTKPS